MTKKLERASRAVVNGTEYIVRITPLKQRVISETYDGGTTDCFWFVDTDDRTILISNVGDVHDFAITLSTALGWAWDHELKEGKKAKAKNAKTKKGAQRK